MPGSAVETARDRASRVGLRPPTPAIGRSAKLTAIERLTARRLFELLRTEGYQGAYDSVQRYVRAWRRARSQQGTVFIPLWFAPGEAYQFDWSHEVVVLGGV